MSECTKPPDFNQTAGAVLVGTIVAAFLSGSVTMQSVAYFRFYWDDRLCLKLLVLLIWILDTTHISMAAAGNWDMFIRRWGSDSIITYIPWPIAVTIVITALMTFLVQCFFAYRIYIVGRKNLSISIPLGILALLRLAAATGSTSQMLRLMNYRVFASKDSWLFTLGLAMSTLVDIIATASLCYFLKRSRTGIAQTDHIIDILTLYTVQSGLITTVVTIVSLICWVSMSHNLIFLGIHLTISKLYANALIATLNARRTLRQDTTIIYDTPSTSSKNRGDQRLIGTGEHGHEPSSHIQSFQAADPLRIQVDIEKTVQSASTSTV